MKTYKHTFSLNPAYNGGEQLVLCTTATINDYSEVVFTQELTLNSYCNAASFHLEDAFTSENLREMAEQLEGFKKKVYAIQAEDLTKSKS